MGGEKVWGIDRTWWGYGQGRGRRQKPSTGPRPAPRGKRSEPPKRRRRRRAASAAKNGPKKPPKERTRGRHAVWRPRAKRKPRHERSESRRLASDPPLAGHEAKRRKKGTRSAVRRGGDMSSRLGEPAVREAWPASPARPNTRARGFYDRIFLNWNFNRGNFDIWKLKVNVVHYDIKLCCHMFSAL